MEGGTYLREVEGRIIECDGRAYGGGIQESGGKAVVGAHQAPGRRLVAQLEGDWAPGGADTWVDHGTYHRLWWQVGPRRPEREGARSDVLRRQLVGEIDHGGTGRDA